MKTKENKPNFIDNLMNKIRSNKSRFDINLDKLDQAVKEHGQAVDSLINQIDRFETLIKTL